MKIHPAKSSTRNTRRPLVALQSLLTHGIIGLACAYIGVLIGMSGNAAGPMTSSHTACQIPPPSPPSPPQECPPCEKSKESAKATTTTTTTTPFPETLGNFVVDYTTVDRADLNRLLEIGVPLDDPKKGAQEALILYSSATSRPSAKTMLLVSKSKSNLTAAQATENCKTVKLILTEPSQKQENICIALLPQWESYYVHKFMRLPKKLGGLKPDLPLRYVPRSSNEKGQESGTPDYKRHTKPAYKELIEYLNALDATLEELKPMLEPIATPNKSIVVSVVNYGQLLLFENFLCNAHAKGIDTSHLFLFATDEKTYTLAQKYGVAVYYNAAIFGDLPEAAAGGYGDGIFTKMMMAKVYCVHLVISCGFNVLFQDVDLVWYRDPLPYLESEELGEWDLMFQDDGARSHRYAPYSPNTGTPNPN
jgi:Nucleotide-diphospho-sugar transferase